MAEVGSVSAPRDVVPFVVVAAAAEREEAVEVLVWVLRMDLRWMRCRGRA